MKKFLITITLVITAFVLASLGVSIFKAPIYAADAANWRAGNIISDAIFTDTNSMSVQDIQNFLNKTIGSCDVDGTKPATEFGRSDLTHAQYASIKGWPGPPYTCLNLYYEVPKLEAGGGMPVNNYANPSSVPSGAQSAAWIIKDAANRYSISPKVLLVKIATESAGPLTSDKWPLLSQYRYAMGAHCPDSGPNGSANCDPAYSGFSLQVYEAAALMRWYLDSMSKPWWSYKKPYETNSILWNVVERGCGAGDVYIENKATAALYTYTPYQPNQAALNNLYGTGDNCSAYGNRNFWRVFTDWFGSTNSIGDEPYAIWRLFNTSTNTHFITASAPEASAYLQAGWRNDGVVSRTSTTSTGIPVYRLWNSRTQSHFFTANAAEKDTYVSAGWHNDGEIFKAPASGTPVWRLFNGRSHFFTANIEEYELYLQNGWHSDGIVFFEPTSRPLPVWRLFNPRTGAHILTGNIYELTTYLENGWHSDDIVMSRASTGIPVYRLWNSRTQSHFFTANAAEKDTYVSAGWHNDGEIFKAPASGTPVWRLFNGRSHFFTANVAEKDTYVSAGWHNDGIVFYTSNTLLVRRLRNKDTNAYMLNANVTSLWSSEASKWVDEGATFNASSNYGAPVYQLRNEESGSYFYTKSIPERDTYAGAGWINDGVIFYAPPSGIPIYRLFNSSSRIHIIVAGTQNINSYTSTGWSNDGIVFNGIE